MYMSPILSFSNFPFPPCSLLFTAGHMVYHAIQHFWQRFWVWVWVLFCSVPVHPMTDAWVLCHSVGDCTVGTGEETIMHRERGVLRNFGKALWKMYFIYLSYWLDWDDLVNKIIQISGAQFHKTSSAHCIVCSPQVESPSIAINLPFTVPYLPTPLLFLLPCPWRFFSSPFFSILINPSIPYPAPNRLPQLSACSLSVYIYFAC